MDKSSMTAFVLMLVREYGTPENPVESDVPEGVFRTKAGAEDHLQSHVDNLNRTDDSMLSRLDWELHRPHPRGEEIIIRMRYKGTTLWMNNTTYRIKEVEYFDA